MAHAVGKAALLALTPACGGTGAGDPRNAVAPGPVLPPPDANPRHTAAAARRTLLKRWGEPEDVALAVKYLLEADYVTGDVVTVDGGERYGARTAGAPN